MITKTNRSWASEKSDRKKHKDCAVKLKKRQERRDLKNISARSNNMAASFKEDIEGIQKLKDPDTFPLWEFELKIIFKAKQLMGIVDGTVQPPTSDDKKKDEWHQKDALAQYYIMRTVDLHVKSHILSCTTSNAMFESLQKVYKKDTDRQKSKLLADFYNFKFDKSLDVM